MDLTKIMLDFAQAAKDNNPAEEGDYFNDGLLYCGKCNTPKQCHINIGKDMIVHCMCKCKAEEAKREEERAFRQKMLEDIKLNRATAFAYRQWANATFDKDDGANPDLTNMLKNYSLQFRRFYADGKGLLLFGSTGSGKSFGAACIANDLLDRGYTVRMTNFASISKEALSTFEKEQYYDSLLGCDLLVLDDFASERKTEFMNETVYDVINSRYENKLPVIVTTNLSSEEIKHPTDKAMQRVCSRLLASTIPIEVSGTDRRKSILRNDYGDYINILKGES